MSHTKPLVSVFMATYNHAPFIAEALDSCLMQETDFPFEIVVCDDFSTDGTRAIVEEYAKKHDNIVLSFQKHNTKGQKNFMDGMALLQGKYVAFCEGDDFWLCKDKLQKQISFLEENPDFSVCCHKVEVRLMGRQESDVHSYIYKDLSYDEERIQKGEFYADECLTNYYFQTSSVVFRWRFGGGFPSWFTLNMLLDHFLFMLHAVEGKVKYFNEAMSAWRRQSGGYSWLQTINKGLFFTKELTGWVRIYEEIDLFFSYRFSLQIRERILLGLRNVVNHYVQTNQLEKINYLYTHYKKYFNSPVLENAIMLDGLRLAAPSDRELFPPWAKLEAVEENQEKPRSIGGHFPLDIASIPEAKDNVWQAWTKDKEYAAFANAEQALIAWLWSLGVRDLWIPTFVAPHILKINPRLPLLLKRYATGTKLEPSADFVKNVEPGHAVYTMAFFGKALSKELEEALLARPDIYWIEDRRQALDTGTASKAHAVIYSPKDLLGVPDGAILVGNNLGELSPKYQATKSPLFFERLKLAMRAMEGPLDNADVLEHSALEQKEQLPGVACSTLTLEMLKRIPIKPLVQKRQENWQYLAKHLGQYALWPEEKVDFAPYVYPLEIPTSHAMRCPVDILLTLFVNNNIFCPPLWQLQNAPSISPSKNCVLLPCDQRCEKEDLDKMIAIVKDYMAGKIQPEDAKAW